MRKLLNKKALSAFLAIVMTLATMVGMFTFSASAETTVQDWDAETVYLNNADDVAEFFNRLITDDNGFTGQKFILTADVDMSEEEITSRVKAHKGFGGEFDGNGHTISNIMVTVSEDSAGVFGRTPTAASTIKNVSFVNVTYSGSYVPGFFYGGTNTDIDIENVFIDFYELANTGTGGGGADSGGYDAAAGTQLRHRQYPQCIGLRAGTAVPVRCL